MSVLSSIASPSRIHFKFWSTLLLIVDHVKIQHVLVVKVLFDDKLSMCHHSDV